MVLANKKVATIQTERRKDSIFLFCILALPVLQFCIFYIGVNFNSFLLSIQEFDAIKGEYYISGLVNFGNVINDIFVSNVLSNAIKNSGIQFVVVTVIGLPVNVFVAYLVWKRLPLAGMFRFLLFLPNTLSSLVFVISLKYLLGEGMPSLLNDPNLKLFDTYTDNAFWTILLITFWMNFSSGMVVYLGAMSSISDELIEYGLLEKINMLQEFWYVIIPSIWPTMITYTVTGIAGYVTNQGMYFAFMGGGGASSTFDTLGYHFFVKVAAGGAVPEANYPYASAAGLIFTFIAAPVTFFVKWFMEKYGPSED